MSPGREIAHPGGSARLGEPDEIIRPLRPRRSRLRRTLSTLGLLVALTLLAGIGAFVVVREMAGGSRPSAPPDRVAERPAVPAPAPAREPEPPRPTPPAGDPPSPTRTVVESAPPPREEAKIAAAPEPPAPEPAPSAPPAPSVAPEPEQTAAIAATPSAAPAPPPDPPALPAPAPAPVADATPPPAAPKRPAPSRVLAAELVEAHLERGRELLEAGDLAAARLFFERVAEAGDPRGALDLARSYDPQTLRTLPVRNPAGDPAAVARWREAARAMAGSAPGR